MSIATPPEASPASRIAASRTTSRKTPLRPFGWFASVMPNSERMAYSPANVPIMNTSEWAKFNSCSTP